MYKWQETGRDLKDLILELVTENPDLDDMEIADRLNADPYQVSVLLQDLEDQGLIIGE